MLHNVFKYIVIVRYICMSCKYQGCGVGAMRAVAGGTSPFPHIFGAKI